jgi:AhpD family alkylhydroperoxidase
VEASVIDDARAAAALMAMNNVYYRFRHMVAKAIDVEKPAGLRMNRLARPATNRVDFELFALAVSAINGCKAYVGAHERAVTEGALTPDHVNDAVRIAATLQGVAPSLSRWRRPGSDTTWSQRRPPGRGLPRRRHRMELGSQRAIWGNTMRRAAVRTRATIRMLVPV